MGTRKVIQIIATPQDIEFDQVMFVLCDDGTIWGIDLDMANTKWWEIAGPPGSYDFSKLRTEEQG